MDKKERKQTKESMKVLRKQFRNKHNTKQFHHPQSSPSSLQRDGSSTPPLPHEAFFQTPCDHSLASWSPSTRSLQFPSFQQLLPSIPPTTPLFATDSATDSRWIAGTQHLLADDSTRLFFPPTHQSATSRQSPNPSAATGSFLCITDPIHFNETIPNLRTKPFSTNSFVEFAPAKRSRGKKAHREVARANRHSRRNAKCCRIRSLAPKDAIPSIHTNTGKTANPAPQ